MKNLLAGDVMERRVVKVRPDLAVADLCDLFQQEHIHGAPVVDGDDELVGFISQEDVLFGMMGSIPQSATEKEPKGGAEEGGAGDGVPRVRDIMTAPAVHATEETLLADVCRLMWQLRIHHVPIIKKGRVTGILSSLDLCRVLSTGEAGV